MCYLAFLLYNANSVADGRRTLHFCNTLNTTTTRNEEKEKGGGLEGVVNILFDIYYLAFCFSLK